MKPEIEITQVRRGALRSEATVCVILPDGRRDGFETLYVEHDLSETEGERTSALQKTIDEWVEWQSQTATLMPTLMDYATGDYIRPATEAEAEASRNAGPEGVILVEIDGYETSCYVPQ